MLCQTRLYYTKLGVDLHQNTCGRQPSQVMPKPESRTTQRVQQEACKSTEKTKKTGSGQTMGVCMLKKHGTSNPRAP